MRKLLIAAVVLIASVLLISNTIQVAAAQRKNETSIMRLVGASRWMTELPFMLETTFAAIVGETSDSPTEAAVIPCISSAIDASFSR